MATPKIKPPVSRLQWILLLTPLWLLLFYFRNDISDRLINQMMFSGKVTRLSDTLEYFFSTFLKISLLLVMIVFVMALLRTWFPAEKIRNRLRSMPQFGANLAAGLFGMITPFCSCSAIPMFIAFLETGIPLGVTFTFLIASPLVNEVILVMLAGLFGIKVTLIYAVSGLTIAVISGMIIGRLQLEKWLPSWLLNFRNDVHRPPSGMSLESRISSAFQITLKTLRLTWIFILAGMVIGVVIHGYVPEESLAGFVASEHWYSMPIAVLAGIPLYACSASIAPVAFALADKGIPTGTAMAFVMAVAAISLPEFIMLKKILPVRLILIFAGVVFTGIVLTGYLFNMIM